MEPAEGRSSETGCGGNGGRRRKSMAPIASKTPELAPYDAKTLFALALLGEWPRARCSPAGAQEVG